MTEKDTPTLILEAARRRLLADGFASMSTRKVAEEAGVPLSQIHYHFGSKEELILALLREENESLVGRQRAMFATDLPLWKRWDLACDYFDEDIASGYVRVLHEMTAAGWSSDSLKKEMQEIYGVWHELLMDVVTEAGEKGISLGTLSPADVVALIGASFVGAETLILIGMEDDKTPYRAALRKVGDVIRLAEEGERNEG